MAEGFTASQPQWKWLEQLQEGWQFGEQGVLMALARRLNVTTCSEIGAGDGEGLPVTIEPFIKGGLRCTLYEIDETKRARLLERFPHTEIRDKWHIDQLGGWFWHDLVVIDIDGYDWFPFVCVANQRKASCIMVEHADKNIPGSDRLYVPSMVNATDHRADGTTGSATEPTLEMMVAGMYTKVGSTRINSVYVRDDRLGLSHYENF